MKTLRMPNPSHSEPAIDEVEHSGTVVIVGANGSGKSRLGAWLESPMSLTQHRGAPRQADSADRKVYRIAAQRSLVLPDRAERIEATQASYQLMRGSTNPPIGVSRIQGDPVVGQSNDFDLLLNTLFA